MISDCCKSHVAHETERLSSWGSQSRPRRGSDCPQKTEKKIAAELRCHGRSTIQEAPSANIQEAP